MSSIIPIKPFGKDLSQSKKSIDSVIDSTITDCGDSNSDGGTSNHSSQVDSSPVASTTFQGKNNIIPAYDFSKVTWRRQDNYLWFENLPFNLYDECNGWRQGIWKRLGMGWENFPPDEPTKKHPFNHWVDWNKKADTLIIPPLPLIFSVLAAMYTVSKTSPSDELLQIRHGLRQAFLFETYTSSQAQLRPQPPNGKVDYYLFRFCHGKGLKSHPVKYEVEASVTSIQSFPDMVSYALSCSDRSFIQSVFYWLAGNKNGGSFRMSQLEYDLLPCILSGGEIVEPHVGVVNPKNAYFGQGYVANPKDFEVK